MRQRNRLLSDAGAEPAWLSALEAQMAEHGTAIGDARGRLVALLNAGLMTRPEGQFPRATVALEGWDQGDLTIGLKQSRARDAVAGRALVGPHRCDLVVTHVAKAQAAALCSTGEQKALLLGLILAHAALVAQQTGRAPILLLDEVAAHLDPGRRAALFEQLAETGSQIWLTGTELSLFDAIGPAASRFTVRDGLIGG
jgi:DNA replication and repair protein RecF